MDESSQTSCYPPSLVVGKRYLQGSGSNIRAHGAVTYRIEAFLHRGDDVICAREVDIKAVNGVDDIPPPVPLDDFPDEYRATVSKPLAGGRLRSWFSHKNIVAKARPHLSISVLEPQAICLVRGLQSESAETIDLMSMFRISLPQNMRADDCFRPDDVHMTMEWSLKTTTFVAVTPMQEMPTRAETMSNGFIGRISAYSAERSAKMVLRNWQSSNRHDSPPEIASACGRMNCIDSSRLGVSKEDRREWLIEQRLHLTVATTQENATTFFTPYISRRHTLQLRLDCHTTGNPITQFQFEVPVQLVLLDKSPCSRQLQQGFVYGPVPVLEQVSARAQAELSASPPYVR